MKDIRKDLWTLQNEIRTQEDQKYERLARWEDRRTHPAGSKGVWCWPEQVSRRVMLSLEHEAVVTQVAYSEVGDGTFSDGLAWLIDFYEETMRSRYAFAPETENA